MNRLTYPFLAAGAALTGLAAGWLLGMAILDVAAADASTGPAVIGTVVGIEKHSNPLGDRWITIQPEQPAFGIWVTEACAISLALGDGWPTSNIECQ